MTKFKHLRIGEGSVLTFVSDLAEDHSKISVGYTVFCAKPGEQWTKREGNRIASERLAASPIVINIDSKETVFDQFLTWIVLREIVDSMIENDFPLQRIVDVKHLSSIWKIRAIEYMLLRYTRNILSTIFKGKS